MWGEQEVHQATWLKIMVHILVGEANHHPLWEILHDKTVFKFFPELVSHMVVVDLDSPLDFPSLT